MKYDNTPYPRPDYFQEVESRLNTLVINTYKNRESDPESSMNNARKAAEAICRCTILKHELTKPNNVPRELDAMIGLLRKNTSAMPQTIVLHTETLQKWGNVGSHFQTTSLTPDDIASAMLALKSLVDWFYAENKLGKAPSQPLAIDSNPIPSGFSRSPEEPRHYDVPDEVLFSVEDDEPIFEPDFNPIFEAAKADDSGRISTTNFYLDIEFNSQHGKLTFRSPDSSLVENPVYAAVKSSYFFDLNEIFSAITDVISSLLKLEPADIVIHYNDPGEWQLCAPEFLYDDESPNDDATIPFDISYHKSTPSRRTQDFSLYLNSYMIQDENLRLYFPPKFMIYPLKEKKLLSYYGIADSSFWMEVSSLIRLAHPTYYASVNLDFSLPETVLLDDEEPVQISLGYTLNTRPHTRLPDTRLRETLYERDDARASLADAEFRLKKLARCQSILSIVNLIGMIVLVTIDSVFFQAPIGILLCCINLLILLLHL